MHKITAMFCKPHQHWLNRMSKNGSSAALLHPSSAVVSYTYWLLNCSFWKYDILYSAEKCFHHTWWYIRSSTFSFFTKMGIPAEAIQIHQWAQFTVSTIVSFDFFFPSAALTKLADVLLGCALVWLKLRESTLTGLISEFKRGYGLFQVWKLQ